MGLVVFRRLNTREQAGRLAGRNMIWLAGDDILCDWHYDGNMMAIPYGFESV